MQGSYSHDYSGLIRSIFNQAQSIKLKDHSMLLCRLLKGNINRVSLSNQLDDYIRNEKLFRNADEMIKVKANIDDIDEIESFLYQLTPQELSAAFQLSNPNNQQSWNEFILVLCDQLVNNENFDSSDA